MCPSSTVRRVISVSAVVIAAMTPLAASGPGRGVTAQFEIDFMEFTIDHHFAALRMTELAAGTELQRSGDLANPHEGTSPTPGFEPTPAKAGLHDLLSLARRNNRVQREEIRSLQMFLQEWYGIKYEPKIRPENQEMIDILERAAPGDEFHHAFLETFSRHHFTLTQPVNGCLTGTDLEHVDLRRMCMQMWHSQMADIDEMRNELARHLSIVDYKPFNGSQPLAPQPGSPRGEHTGSEQEH
jgi:uncharacterized protein (DUF305 family)